MEHRLLRKDGIFFQGSWLCSAACFEAAVAGSLAGDEATRVFTMPRLPRMPFRLLLLERGVVSEAGLAEALRHAECTGLTLARALLSLRLVTEAELAASLAAENGCAYYSLPPAPVAPEAHLPLTLAEGWDAASVHVAPGRVLVGFVHRIDRELVRCFESMTGLKVEICMITASHRARQLALARAGAEVQAEAPQQVAGPGELGRGAVRHALRFGAEQVWSRRIGGLIWVRMSAGTRIEDCFFKFPEEAVRSVPVKSQRAQPFSGTADGKKLQVL